MKKLSAFILTMVMLLLVIAPVTNDNGIGVVNLSIVI